MKAAASRGAHGHPPALQRRTLLAGALASGAALAAPSVFAQAVYPNRPIRALQGFAVGGNADAIARLVGAEMSKVLGQPIVVESLAGAGGTKAAGEVARAAPDGYTLLLATGGHSVAGALQSKLPYDTVASFQAVSTITFFPFLIVVRADSPWRSLADLLPAARHAAEGVAWGSAGVGTTHHLAGELLAKSAGLKLLHVPYRGDAMATTALLGGEVPFIIAPATAVEAHVRAGKLRALAVTGAQRWLGMPEVPTVAQQGVAGYDVRSWAGWLLPAGAPKSVVQRLNEATRLALLSPDVRGRLRQMGGEAQAGTPDDMHTLVAQELRKWTQLARDAGIPKL
ncbi:tripartite tricarboxylate transporter substrate binding protein [Aquincola sp. S2]|uniref:Tripartite tricarboxylate transporter substrate binding protein n=1 Tax=Pseudaquabacterium terrae TaxID=2732868 RepID=A0ABX2EGI4_9BURK|nr:tripartite tricarboxylate transporter substrate-binding protein [Aquabacterium terrae]NRF67720.1 tripartite tricarboxylate transporter substrate binding protein [Aquabacterium terrae]